MKNLKPVNIKNLQRIFDGIESGKLEHKQSMFFCGTAACLAGWDLRINLPEIYEDAYEGNGCVLDKKINKRLKLANLASNIWEWSRKNNNLTRTEAKLLYSPQTPWNLQKVVFDLLKSGYRFTDDADGCSRLDSIRREPEDTPILYMPESDFNEEPSFFLLQERGFKISFDYYDLV